MSQAQNDRLYCACCGQAHRWVPLAPGRIAHCTRCEAVMARGHRLEAPALLALTLAALLVLVMANVLPLVTIRLRGAEISTSFPMALLATWRDGAPMVAALCFFTALVAPFSFVALRLYLLLPWAVGRQAPGLGFCLRLLDITDRWNTVSAACAADRFDVWHFIAGDRIQKWRVMNVCAGIVPGVNVAAGNVNRVPQVVTFHAGFVLLGKHLWLNRSLDRRGDFFRSRPDFFQVNVFAVAVLPDRFVDQIDVGRAGQRVGNDQRWTGQVVGFGQRIDATFEVAIAAQHGRGDQIAGLDCVGNRFRQRTTVADARRATIADGVKTQAFQETRSDPLCPGSR